MEFTDFWIRYKGGGAPKEIETLHFNSWEEATNHIVNVLEKDEKYAGKEFEIAPAWRGPCNPPSGTA